MYLKIKSNHDFYEVRYSSNYSRILPVGIKPPTNRETIKGFIKYDKVNILTSLPFNFDSNISVKIKDRSGNRWYTDLTSLNEWKKGCTHKTFPSLDHFIDFVLENQR